MEEKNPPAIMLYAEKITMLKMLNDEQLSKVMRATFEFYSDGVIPELGQVEMICFSQLQNDILRNVDKYEKICKRNKENRNKYKNNDQSSPLVQTETKTKAETETKTKKETETKTESPKRYDEQGRELNEKGYPVLKFDVDRWDF